MVYLRITSFKYTSCLVAYYRHSKSPNSFSLLFLISSVHLYVFYVIFHLCEVIVVVSCYIVIWLWYLPIAVPYPCYIVIGYITVVCSNSATLCVTREPFSPKSWSVFPHTDLFIWGSKITPICAFSQDFSAPLDWPKGAIKIARFLLNVFDFLENRLRNQNNSIRQLLGKWVWGFFNVTKIRPSTRPLLLIWVRKHEQMPINRIFHFQMTNSSVQLNKFQLLIIIAALKNRNIETCLFCSACAQSAALLIRLLVGYSWVNYIM